MAGVPVWHSLIGPTKHMPTGLPQLNLTRLFQASNRHTHSMPQQSLTWITPYWWRVCQDLTIWSLPRILVQENSNRCYPSLRFQLLELRFLLEMGFQVRFGSMEKNVLFLTFILQVALGIQHRWLLVPSCWHLPFLLLCPSGFCDEGMIILYISSNVVGLVE